MVINIGFLFYFFSVIFGCVFYKIKWSILLFFFFFESYGFEVFCINDINCLV